MVVDVEEFNGNPVMAIKRDQNDNYPFRFGLRKAQLIIENIDEIKKFVNKYTK